MQAGRQISIGAALAAPAVAAAAISAMSGRDAALTTIYVFGAAGVLAALIGAARGALGGFYEAEAKAQDPNLTRNRAIIRSLFAVAAADGELAERELNVIENFASKIADVEIGDDLVRELFEETKTKPVDIEAELGPAVKALSTPERRTAYQGAALVAHSRQPVGPNERAALDKIAKALELPPAMVSQVERRAEEAFADDAVTGAVKYWLGLRD